MKWSIRSTAQIDLKRTSKAGKKCAARAVSQNFANLPDAMEIEASDESNDGAVNPTSENTVTNNSAVSPSIKRGLPISTFDGKYYTAPLSDRKANRPTIPPPAKSKPKSNDPGKYVFEHLSERNS